MENSSSITKKIDEFVFGQVDSFKNSSIYQQIMDQFSTLDDSAQKHINQFFAILVVFVPIILIVVLEIQSYKIGTRLNIKRNLYNSLAETSIKSRRLSFIERKVLGPRKITSQNELQDIINQIIKSIGIRGNKIKLTGVTTSDLSPNLGKLSATIRFNSFSTPNVTNLLRDLIKKEKMVITKLSINKNTRTELLEGEFLIHHHYRLN
ncbi:MAG: hypothetical protein DRQ88_03345 [Epsilonproteobacteria bacterium]|nr:MAG: hypothetical protein DRQ89_01415 [Campylobacterota bacterium]RLA67354.1 MAG: hypothetical protein DRQ88_03345 [Campylobacterota bacterium]